MNQPKERRDSSDRIAAVDREGGAPPLLAVGQDDPRVIQALDDYLAAQEAGQKPDRWVFLARHGEIAEALAKCLDGLEFVQKAAPQLDQQVVGTALSAITGELATTMPLGDFRIVREIGRGGMGVVYEAEQLSLGRRVALKVLPFAAALDARQLQRFKNEAQAAAHLHHTNIVPVFGVGCERGVHFYAMQYIEGQTLAQIIADLKLQKAGKDQAANGSSPADGDSKPTLTTGQGGEATRPSISLSRCFAASSFFRTVANLGLQAAEALEHAHQVGVVHRDIKPANLLVDGWGKLWITDFGLARFHADAGLTLSGDLLGTLRYMSPEQAVGKWVPGDHRTDIYSLGATLYEMLTLKPAFNGGNREELLAQIASAEPLRARQVNNAVPAELETIVRKAMEKKPEERYGAAKDLADDLRRFLEDKPILAKPPTLTLRAKKWSRRHKPVVMTAVIAVALILPLVIAGLVAAILLITREKNRTQEALKEAKANFETAEENRRRAEANFQNALIAVDQMVSRASEEQLAGVPQMDPFRRNILEDALHFLETVIQENSTDPAMPSKMAPAYFVRVAYIQAALGPPDQAQKAYQQALDLFARLQTRDPDTAAYHRNWLASNSSSLANSFRANPARHKEAQTLFRQAVDGWKKLIADFPENADYQAKLAQTRHDFAYFLWITDRIMEAEESYRLALAGYEQLATDNPNQVSYRISQARIHNSIGVLLETTGRPQDAEQAFRRALKIFEKDPTQQTQGERVRSQVHLALLLAQTGQFEEAEKVLRLLTRQAEDGGAKDPDGLALGYRHLAVVLAAVGQFEEAEQKLQKVIDIQKKLLAQTPSNASFRFNLAISHHYLGNLLRDTGRIALAEESYREALTQGDKLVASFPEKADYQLELARIQSDRGNCLTAAGRAGNAQEAYHKAKEGFQQALLLSPNRHDLPYQLARFLANCPDPQFRHAGRAVDLARKAVGRAPQAWYCWRTLGQAQYRFGNWKASVTALEKSMELYANGGNASDWFFLAMAHWQLGDQPHARQWFEQAVKWMDKYQPKNEELGRFRAEAEALTRP
jgi:hypothetical protein